MSKPLDRLGVGGALVPPRPAAKWVVRGVSVTAIILALASATYFTRDLWRPAPAGDQVLLSEQAQKNLRLAPAPLKVESYWKTVSVPGIVIDRPGHGDHGVVSPVTGTVSRIHHVAGDEVRPGDTLFTLKLLS